MTTTIDHTDDTSHHIGAMNDTTPPDTEVSERSPGRRRFSAKYKAKVLAEYDAIEDRSVRGALLRRETVLVDADQMAQATRTWRRRSAGPTSWPSKGRSP